MGNMTTALVFIMTLNVLMWFSQLAVLNMEPAAPEFYHCSGSMMESIDKNKCTGTPELDDSKLGNELPSSQASISPSTGNLFVDIFSSVKTWILDTLGVKYLISMLMAPYNMLKPAFGQEIAFGIGALWYAVTFVVIIAFLWGRDV